MSFFSDINGFNAKAMQNIYEVKDENKDDFSEVDFCLDNFDDALFSPKQNESVQSFTPFEEELYMPDDETEEHGIDTEG